MPRLLHSQESVAYITDTFGKKLLDPIQKVLKLIVYLLIWDQWAYDQLFALSLFLFQSTIVFFLSVLLENGLVISFNFHHFFSNSLPDVFLGRTR
ncbi:MAG: hypothetical protein CSA81_01250 [Acidobacteria bacterium]|nr:MAG: hypothetical protein CSA81_01250 [Acidobacteriota bacterium]